ncbi:MAG: c-type cytochrome [Hyphomicrobiaceae bacterium]
MLDRTRCAAGIGLMLLAMPAQAQTFEDKLAACVACHGETGIPKEADVPIIWGQHTGYLYLQLRDYKEGTRKNDIMNAMAADMTKQEMMAFAENFAKRPWPKMGYRSTADADRIAERAAVGGACTECHLGGYVGDSTVPRAAGQIVTYLEKTMLDFKTKARGNNPSKSTLMATFSDDEIRAMAKYLAGL